MTEVFAVIGVVYLIIPIVLIYRIVHQAHLLANQDLFHKATTVRRPLTLASISETSNYMIEAWKSYASNLVYLEIHRCNEAFHKTVCILNPTWIRDAVSPETIIHAAINWTSFKEQKQFIDSGFQNIVTVGNETIPRNALSMTLEELNVGAFQVRDEISWANGAFMTGYKILSDGSLSIHVSSMSQTMASAAYPYLMKAIEPLSLPHDDDYGGNIIFRGIPAAEAYQALEKLAEKTTLKLEFSQSEDEAPVEIGE